MAEQAGTVTRGGNLAGNFPQRLVAYERVSTARQGAIGLGLKAQRKSIEDFAASRGAEVLARFTEVESGKRADWPQLTKSLHLAKVTGATLVIAKLDRLSRNAAFLLALRDSSVRFVAVDMPEANDLTVGIMALVAQAERVAISRRTREALAVAKARGVKFGQSEWGGKPQAGGEGRCGAQGGGARECRGVRARLGGGGRGHPGGGSCQPTGDYRGTCSTWNEDATGRSMAGV